MPELEQNTTASVSETPAAEPSTTETEANYADELAAYPTDGGGSGDEAEGGADEPAPEGTTQAGAEQPETDEELPANVKAIYDDMAGKMKGLNLQDPNVAKLLRQMAHKEAYIQEFKSKQPQAQAQPDEGLTEFEKQLRSKPTETPAQPEVKAPEPAPRTNEAPPPSDPLQIMPLIGAWQASGNIPQSIAKSEAEAWASAGDNPEAAIQAVARVRAAHDSLLVRSVLGHVEAMLKDRLGSVENKFQPFAQTVERGLLEQNMQKAQSEAVEELKRIPDLKGPMDELFKVRSQNPIAFEGQQFDDTMLNEILQTNPELRSIRVEHQDPLTAHKLSLIAMYRMAARIAKGRAPKGVPPQQAAELVKTGEKLAEQKRKDDVRKTLNSGQGASKSIKQTPGNYADELESFTH